MTSQASQHGYQVAPQELSAQAGALAEIGDRTGGLAASASRLAERRPMLGTAPPALHLAVRLCEAAGRAGLTGDVSAAGNDLGDFHRALKASVDRYLEREADIAQTFRTTGGAET
ncbi:hypothetical protein [Amycolatopsis nigrescens]|uniref:hypothetical protein n=1 Tax=Amycolatopsis nigrescens TaxID=381445 RepID=UPI00037C6794|nr:hypothetical protein [Amycolatopsis nigrescens]